MRRQRRWMPCSYPGCKKGDYRHGLCTSHASSTPLVDGMLLAVCWCGDTFVFLPKRDVFNGRTVACDRDECRAPRSAA